MTLAEPTPEEPLPEDALGLSLDISKVRLGYARWVGPKLIKVGAISFKDVPPHATGELLTRFQADFRAMAKNLHWAAYEDVRPVAQAHMEIHFGMSGVVKMEALRVGAPVIQVTSPSAKKRLSGNGHARKEDMLAAAQHLYPEVGIENHDIADAVAVGLVAIDKIRAPVV